MTIKPVDGKTTVYSGFIVRELEARYGFLETPRRLAEFDFEKGVRFLRGIFEGHIVDLEIYTDGLKSYCAADTSVCDAFIDDIVVRAKELRVEFMDIEEQRIYVSALEVEFDGNFDVLFDRFARFGEMVGSMISNYGGPKDQYRGHGLTFVGGLQGPQPEPFRLERRVNHPFDSRIFYAVAPLTTADHVRALYELERITLS